MLSGAAYGAELGDMQSGPSPGRDGHFLAAIKIAAFEDVERFKSRVDAAVRELHACRRAPGYERVYAPGEPEALRREAYSRDGVPLNDVTLADLRRVAAALGVDAAALGADWPHRGALDAAARARAPGRSDTIAPWIGPRSSSSGPA